MDNRKPRAIPEARGSTISTELRSRLRYILTSKVSHLVCASHVGDRQTIPCMDSPEHHTPVVAKRKARQLGEPVKTGRRQTEGETALQSPN